jgi:hypothetical protein
MVGKRPEDDWKFFRGELETAYRTRLEPYPKLAGNFPEAGWKKVPSKWRRFYRLQNTNVLFLCFVF